MADATDGARVAVVTGASRGLGKGIAAALGSQGWTVYVTGRSSGRPTEPELGGTIEESARAVSDRGGVGVGVVCDHREDDQVSALFERVQTECGHLDVLVNNAFFLSPSFFDGTPFWERPLSEWDLVDVGLRSHYVATVCAAPMMVARGQGLIVHTSSFGARYYGSSVAYGIGKAGVERLARDAGHELGPFGVTSISLWPGLMSTERTVANFAKDPAFLGGMSLDIAESPEFSGRVIDALASDPDVTRHNGKTLVGAEIALDYGVTDIDGSQPASLRHIYGGGPLEDTADAGPPRVLTPTGPDRTCGPDQSGREPKGPETYGATSASVSPSMPARLAARSAGSRWRAAKAAGAT
jgi:NAD(P)-dependent dehydrogenase (short-subunit alcohol dehydrogenase family)